ncbi:hypothetical protein BOX15_Mlig030687g1 [Macrostomum lignano]|nr:hypothetical protein BOX15_Mlig030687g1 [Macrostomum lignano]
MQSQCYYLQYNFYHVRSTVEARLMPRCQAEKYKRRHNRKLTSSSSVLLSAGRGAALLSLSSLLIYTI